MISSEEVRLEYQILLPRAPGVEIPTLFSHVASRYIIRWCGYSLSSITSTRILERIQYLIYTMMLAILATRMSPKTSDRSVISLGRRDLIS